MARIKGTRFNDRLSGTNGDDRLIGDFGDDALGGGGGQDRLRGDAGFDVLRGGAGDDKLYGGADTDFLFGGAGNDTLHGDNGRNALAGSDRAGNRLDGGAGDDVLVLGEGLNTATGGSGDDTFLFKANNPQTPLAAGTGAAFTTITDFSTADDTLAFDSATVGSNTAMANFVDLSGGGGQTASFYAGGAAGANGENVVVLNEVGFATGALAAQTLAGEQAGGMILYFNTTVGVASLLVVSAPDTVVSIARFVDIGSVEELAAANFTASDFVFV